MNNSNEFHQYNQRIINRQFSTFIATQLFFQKRKRILKSIHFGGHCTWLRSNQFFHPRQSPKKIFFDRDYWFFKLPFLTKKGTNFAALTIAYTKQLTHLFHTLTVAGHTYTSAASVKIPFGELCWLRTRIEFNRHSEGVNVSEKKTFIISLRSSLEL